MKPKATSLAFGVVLGGPGRAWVDDLELLVDGKPLRSVRKSSNLWKLAVDSAGHAVGDPVPLTTGSSLYIQPALSRDGTKLVFASHPIGLSLVDLKTGELTHLAAKLGEVGLPVFGGSGQNVYLVGWSAKGDTTSDYEVSVADGAVRTLFDSSMGGI